MYPTLDIMLAGIRHAVENHLLPELRSAFARTQALALLEDVEIMRERLEHLGPALARQNRDVRELAGDIDDALAAPSPLQREVAASLRRYISKQSARTYLEVDGYRPVSSVVAENVDWRTLYQQIIRTLCLDPNVFEHEPFKALRDRARERWMDKYGLTRTFTHVWVE